MLSILSNKDIYANTAEFNNWAKEGDLLNVEKYLIENFLDKQGKTIEAGTGAGRIVINLKDMGFESLYGFDFLPEYIERAKQREPDCSIVFEVQDATDLNYEDCYFEQVIYLQQVVSSIEEEQGRMNALKESYRILRKGGTALFSFLSFEVRSRSITYLPYLLYVQLYRKLRGLNRSIQYLPWMKLGGKTNFLALLDRRPYVYWYKLQEAYDLLREVGFQIAAIGSDYQIERGKMHKSLETLVKEPITGMIYFVCKK